MGPRKQRNGRRTDVDDPLSLGLITFSKQKVPQHAFVHTAYGVQTRVRADQWNILSEKYKDELFSNYNRAGKRQKCRAKQNHRHNCLVDADGSHLDSCMEYTRLAEPITHEDLVSMDSWDRNMYRQLLKERLPKETTPKPVGETTATPRKAT